ncbi:unnamed protein product [Ophioblennius macclurei]
MTAAAGRAWEWLRTWSAEPGPRPPKSRGQEQSARGSWTSWMWGGWRRQSEQGSPVEEYWEALEKVQQAEVRKSSWWSRYLPTSYLWSSGTEQSGPRPHKHERDVDGDFSDYGTPPPSPTPSSPLTSPFRLFVHSWTVDILPEHYEICFNFLRHLFDLFVVGFLWTVSPPTKLVLEVLGVQGPLRLWLHGMAMFFVSTVGMAGLLWLIQEYLPQFALIYGIIQAVVISVSVRQSVMLGVDEDTEEREDDQRDQADERKDSVGGQLVLAQDKVKRC